MNMPSSLPANFAKPGGFTQRVSSVANQAGPTLGAFVNSVRARKWLVIGITMLVLALAAVVASLMTPIFRSTATLLIENSKSKVVSIEELYGVPVGSREFFQTQAEFMKSREVGMRVINRLDLTTNPHFDPRQSKPGLLASMTQWIPLPEGMRKPQVDGQRVLTEEELAEVVLEKYRNGIDIVPVGSSQLVQIRFESPDPTLAARIANQTAESYVTADLDARFNMQQSASKWLNERLESLRVDLERSERALQAYREEIGLVATPASSMGGNVRSLDTSAERLILARVERAQAEQIYRQVQGNSPGRYQVPAVLNNLSVAAARERESQAEKRFAEISQTLGPSHPQYTSALNDLNVAREITRRQADSVIASIARQYEVARSTEKALEQAVAASKGDIRDINRKEGQLNVLERDVATNTQVYQTFLARVKETSATADFRNPIARVVDPAVPSLQPFKPQKKAIVALGGLLGFIVACTLAVLLEQRSAVIRSSDEVIEKLGAPLIVAVPKVTGKDVARLGRLQHDEPNSTYSEAVRSALTGVRLSLLREPKPIVAFTSTLPNEGKSTLALSYAIEQARTKKTLLIDADMRKPSLHSMLKMPASSLGLVEMLAGSSAEKCVQFLPELGLSVLVTSKRVENAHDLLMSPEFAEALDSLRNQFELIVIDTPPLELVSDAMPVGLLATGMIYVVKGGETLIPMARRGLDRLHDARVNVLGVILNAHDFERAGRYYGEYSAYGAYGKGYYGDGKA